MGWFDKRHEAAKVNAEWQEELNESGIDNKGRAIETNKNYKAHIGKTSAEIIQERNTNKEGKKAKDYFTEEELEREIRLEKKQLDNIELRDNKKAVIKKLENTREDKKSWW